MDDLKKLGRYEIESILGQGAMGIVYKGFDPHIERIVAIKTIRKDALATKEMEPLLARFKREAQAAGRLTHAGIVTVYEYGEEDDSAYIAMEFVQGRELKDPLDNNERFPLNTTISITTQLLDALEYSHSQGVVHRDIKPGNIILLDDGRIKVTDFGIARIESSTLTQFGDVIGTPSYMSPEQFGGQQIDNRSDIFSAGVILYHMLTGEKPFPGNSMTTIMHRVINTSPPLASDLNFQVPPVLDTIVLKALAKKPANRFQTAGEFSAALKNAHDLSMKKDQHGADSPVMVNFQDERTIDLPAAEIPQSSVQHVSGEDLQHKFDKIMGLLEARGIINPDTDLGLYHRARSVVLTIMVLTLLSLCAYSVWIIYTEELTYKDLHQIAAEKKKNFTNLFTGKGERVFEISESLKKKPADEFKKEPALHKNPAEVPLSSAPASYTDKLQLVNESPGPDPSSTPEAMSAGPAENQAAPDAAN